MSIQQNLNGRAVPTPPAPPPPPPYVLGPYAQGIGIPAGEEHRAAIVVQVSRAAADPFLAVAVNGRPLTILVDGKAVGAPVLAAEQTLLPDGQTGIQLLLAADYVETRDHGHLAPGQTDMPPLLALAARAALGVGAGAADAEEWNPPAFTALRDRWEGREVVDTSDRDRVVAAAANGLHIPELSGGESAP